MQAELEVQPGPGVVQYLPLDDRCAYLMWDSANLAPIKAVAWRMWLSFSTLCHSCAQLPSLRFTSAPSVQRRACTCQLALALMTLATSPPVSPPHDSSSSTLLQAGR